MESRRSNRKIKAISLLLSVLALIAIILTILWSRNTYVGVIYPPYPSGCVRIGGSFFWDAAQQSFSSSLASEEVQCEGGRFLWMKEVLRRTDKEVKEWRVVESLRLPIKDDTRKLVAGGCSYEGSEGDLVFSVLEASSQSNDSSYVCTGISFIGDLKSKKFKAIDEEKVICDDVEEE